MNEYSGQAKQISLKDLNTVLKTYLLQHLDVSGNLSHPLTVYSLCDRKEQKSIMSSLKIRIVL